MSASKHPTKNYLERIHNLLNSEEIQGDTDPLASLSHRFSENGLRIHTTRMALSEAMWQAHEESPIVVWCERENRYLMVSRAGMFRVKIYQQGDDLSHSVTCSRGRLAERLGLSNVNETLEIGVVHLQLMAEAASARTGKKVESHGHEDEHHHADHMPPLRRLVQLLTPDRREIFLLLIFAIFSSILYLTVPFAVDRIVTNLAFGNQVNPYIQALVVIAQLLAACLILQAMILGFQYFVAEVIQRKIFLRIAGDLAYRLPRVVVKAFKKNHGPELVNHFLDVVTVQKNTAFFLLEGINLVTSTLIGLIILAMYHPLLMGFVLILIVAIVLLTWPLGRKAQNTAIQESKSKYELVSWFEQIAAFPFMFKGSGGYEFAYQRTDELSEQYVLARRLHFRIVLRQISGLLLISVIASVALLVIGALLVLRQQLTLGQLVASELIMSSIVTSLVKLSQKLETFYDTLAATDKLGYLLDLETESNAGEIISEAPSNQGMKVVAKDLCFCYVQGDNLFENLSFQLNPGDRACIYGPQGSGVSSLLDLCFALKKCSSGFLGFDDLDVSCWRLENLRESMMLLRRDELVSGSILDNLRLGREDISIDEIHRALELVGLLDDCLHHANGLNLNLQFGGSPFTTRQRLALLVARALVQKPRLLLIDEIFDGLDNETFQQLAGVVFDRNRPWTVLIATRVDEVQALCDREIQLS